MPKKLSPAVRLARLRAEAEALSKSMVDQWINEMLASRLSASEIQSVDSIPAGIREAARSFHETISKEITNAQRIRTNLYGSGQPDKETTHAR